MQKGIDPHASGGVESRCYLTVRSPALLTEQEVSNSWNQIFKGNKFEPEAFDRAEQLLEELRPESPLRHRLTHELDELRTHQITE